MNILESNSGYDVNEEYFVQDIRVIYLSITVGDAQVNYHNVGLYLEPSKNIKKVKKLAIKSISDSPLKDKNLFITSNISNNKGLESASITYTLTGGVEDKYFPPHEIKFEGESVDITAIFELK